MQEPVHHFTFPTDPDKLPGWEYVDRWIRWINRGTDHMSPSRRFWESTLRSTPMEIVLFFMLSLNIIVLVVQTDNDASGVRSPQSVAYVSYAITVFYSAEMMFRIYVYRLRILVSPVQLFDLVLVFADVVMFFITAITPSNDNGNFSPAILRIFRLARLGRAARLLKFFPELYIISTGIVRAMKAMMFGVMLVYLWLLVMSILAVQIVHPISQALAEEGVYDGCERCPRAFSSVWNSMMTFTQTLLAGDSWGQTALPIIEREPLTYFFFMLVLTSVCLAILNLILATIVDAAAEARKLGEHEQVRAKEQAKMDATKYLVALCKHLDSDSSGSLTCAELKKGMNSNREFGDCMRAMDCGEDDLDVVFSILDADKSGDVNYEEFATELHRMKCNDSHTMLLFIKHYVKTMHDDVLTDMRGVFEGEFKNLKEQVLDTKTEIIKNREEVKLQNLKTRTAVNQSRTAVDLEAHTFGSSFQDDRSSERERVAGNVPGRPRRDDRSEVSLIPPSFSPEHGSAMGTGKVTATSTPPSLLPSSPAWCTSFERYPPQQAYA